MEKIYVVTYAPFESTKKSVFGVYATHKLAYADINASLSEYVREDMFQVTVHEVKKEGSR